MKDSVKIVSILLFLTLSLQSCASSKLVNYQNKNLKYQESDYSKVVLLSNANRFDVKKYSDKYNSKYVFAQPYHGYVGSLIGMLSFNVFGVVNNSMIDMAKSIQQILRVHKKIIIIIPYGYGNYGKNILYQLKGDYDNKNEGYIWLVGQSKRDLKFEKYIKYKLGGNIKISYGDQFLAY